MAPQKQKMYKLTMFAHRNPQMSEDEFHAHWSTTHQEKVKEWLVRYGIVKYTQYHSPCALRREATALLASFGEAIQQDRNQLNYDGSAEFVMPDLRCFDRARNDPYYKSVVAKDEEIFDFDRIKFMVGYEEVWVDDGKVIE